MTLPPDIFPGEHELSGAIGLDELCRFLREEKDMEAIQIAAAIGHRIDRMGFSPTERKVRAVRFNYNTKEVK